MACKPVTTAGGITAIVCTREPRQRCHQCGKPAVKLCDYPVSTHASGTCDRPCCAMHAESQEGDVDYCLAHANWAAKQKGTL